MSHDHVHIPTREEILAGTSRPIPRALYTLAIVCAAIGVVVFIAGASMGVERVWQALLVNWLYFTTISSAGVMFVAVQRITTARWSRSVIRFLEGYVAFLPVAFILLILIFLGKNHIFQAKTCIEEARMPTNDHHSIFGISKTAASLTE